MTTFFYDQPITPPTSGGVAVRLQAFDNAVLSRNATIDLSASNYQFYTGVILMGNNNIQIGGSIFSQGTGILSGNNSTITLTASASVYSSGTWAIDLQGGGNTIINGGIISTSGTAIQSLMDQSNTLYNNGLIQATNIVNVRQAIKIVNTGMMIASSTAIFGGSGNDEIINSGLIQGNSNFNPAAMNLGEGNDVYHGETGTVIGEIRLGSGDDQAYGGSGSETFRGDAGNDYLDGGVGTDTALYNVNEAVTVDLRNTGWQLTSAFSGMDRLINIENVTSFGAGDTLIGNNADNVLTSNGGNDILEGGLGDDTLNGGSEEDTARYTGSAAAIVSLELQGQRQHTGGYGFDTLIEIENLSGGSGNDRFTGDNSANRLSGHAGNDVLYQKENDGTDVLDGGSGIDTVSFAGAAGATISLARTAAQTTAYGSDTYLGIENLSGGSGNDRFTGNTLANSLRGNAGHDTLEGGYGNDVLSGGADTTGRDTFVFRDRLSKTGNVDRITDYHRSYDSIQLDNKHMAKLGPAGRLSSSKFVLGTKAKDANDHLIYDRAKGYLYYDADGSGKAAQVLIAHFTNKAVLYHSEFTVI